MTKCEREIAVGEATDMYIGMLEAMTDNAYMQERAADIQMTKRTLSHLLDVIAQPSID